MYYVGIDLHRKYLTVCVLDSDGTVVAEVRRLPTTAAAVLATLGMWAKPVAVAMEATLHWAWLYDLLCGHGYTVRVAHPFQVKLIVHARCKTDPIDARKLADLLRTNLLPAIWVPDPLTRAHRALLRGRTFLVKTRTRYKNRIHSHLAEHNVTVPVTDLYGSQGRRWLRQLDLPEIAQLQIDLLLELLDELESRITHLSRLIKARVGETPEATLLQTVPGIGYHHALLIWAEIGTLERFPTSHHLASFAGLVPTTHSSGGKTVHGSLPHLGSPWLRWALIEVTQLLKLQPGPVRDEYLRLERAKGTSKATVAAARKLCCYLYWMLRRRWSYAEWQRQHGRYDKRRGARGAPDMKAGAS